MKNVVLNITMQTTRPLGERDLLCAILDLISSVPGLKPKTFGFTEPLKLTWGDGAIREIAPLYQPKGEICFFRMDSKNRGLLTINTTRSPRALFNEIKLVVDYSGVHERLEEVETLLANLANLIEPDYAAATIGGGNPFSVDVHNPEKNSGEIHGLHIPPANPTGIKFLNGIWWINLFGKRYIEFLGQDALQNLPAYRKEHIAPGLFWLQPTRTPVEMWSETGVELSKSIKTKIDRPKAFWGYEKGKPAIMLPYETPAFDFSLVQLKPQP